MANTMTTTTTTIAEGDFKSLKISDWDREMLEDAYKAVTKANRWSFLKRPDVPGPNGFMFSDWPEVKDIDIHMEYGGHSGGSYGSTMRVMEYIAKNGWESYVQQQQQQEQQQRKRKQQQQQQEEERKRKYEPATNQVNNLFRTATVMGGAIQEAAQKGAMDPLAFTQLLQANPEVRQVIPDIDDQAAAMKRFAEGKMSYGEMRSLCG
jgi:hypothetical protein